MAQCRTCIPSKSMPLLGLLLGLFMSMAAQFPHHFRYFSERDGLSDNRVQSILRDQAGFLWVGTANGLNRFDGHSFKQYLPDSRMAGRTISNEGIHDMVQDRQGRIWIATNDGLNCLNPANGEFKVWQNTGRDNSSLPNSLVQGLFLDREDRLWLACDNRDPAMFDAQTQSFVSFPWKSYVHKVLPETGNDDYLTIYQISGKGADELWLGSNKGLFSLKPGSSKFEYHPLGPELKAPSSKSDCPDVFSMGSWDMDVLQFDPCVNTWSQIKLPLPDAMIGGQRHVSKVFQSGNLTWILAHKGLFMADSDVGPVVSIPSDPLNPYSAPSGPITDAWQEPNGTVWIGGEKGLWLCSPQDQYFSSTVLKPNTQGAFYNTFSRFLDLPGLGYSLALDFYSHQLFVSKGGQVLKTLELPPRAGILHRDPEGIIWVGGGKELFQFDSVALRLTPFAFPIPPAMLDPTEASYFIDMATDARGRRWFVNMNEGAFVWDPKDGSWWKPGKKEGLIGENLSCVYADQNGQTMWIGSHDFGLFKYDLQRNLFHLYQRDPARPAHTLGAFMVNGVCQDGKGNVWVATDPGGLSRFDATAKDDQAFSTLGVEEGLPNGRCTGIVTDLHGDIWATTLRGLVWVDHKTLHTRSFGRSDGLPIDFLDMGPWAAADGRIRVGTIGGYFSFHPDSLLHRPADPRILVSGFRIFDRECADSLMIQSQAPITLSWKQNFFSVEFASADILNAGKQQLSYRLKGFDADWVKAGEGRSASYTNVPPGHYTLELRSGREGAWNAAGFSLDLTITPPFWQTWWFRITGISLVLLMAWLLYRWRIRAVQKAADLQTEFNKRIAQTEMAALRAQMNPHFVFNCLSSINRYILVNQADEASAYLTKFAKLIRLILDNSRTETVLLSKELDAIQLYVEMEQMRFNNRFSYKLRVAPGIQPEHVEVPPLLIQPFVENAIWHGLMHKKGQGRLELSLRNSEGRLCVVIEDDGVGREKAMELKSRSAQVNKSHGMKVTSERIEAINSLYQTHATVQTEDLFNADGQACGTRITLKF